MAVSNVRGFQRAIGMLETLALQVVSQPFEVLQAVANADLKRLARLASVMDNCTTSLAVLCKKCRFAKRFLFPQPFHVAILASYVVCFQFFSAQAKQPAKCPRCMPRVTVANMPCCATRRHTAAFRRENYIHFYRRILRIARAHPRGKIRACLCGRLVRMFYSAQYDRTHLCEGAA
ncbi:hypothetical protein VOLCADRAFT_99500 [Volvox carteri f. nagariensis]|uniref:Uncharacterized protein n=1 Tax=Volvox carteri f. nagariensis TaxID=3068 RepID=D8UHY1_VOLCA|nr:uncharacterized protein VOLCADRAFT_99499 [Volvox carteri f. nagariensis]XP_002958265.1 uncharacterized protein VOLCADRAFT_99500 [Volvox carteri f. nagariensis]EFJ40638.1 hypothetical protein VOLCADRAFT_99499 [Volvox carteri f. nagariensis]EFJ40639.1 hypothetical protein VOLCADRAFT_99500 [Volvox carteri f. nagariensis]|eukprot:XP_002958264.1 hypothetical protein VOLCADRAFT_99499 [Volvox carteri f. nagariensis]